MSPQSSKRNVTAQPLEVSTPSSLPKCDFCKGTYSAFYDSTSCVTGRILYDIDQLLSSSRAVKASETKVRARHSYWRHVRK
jgi:hypothetical protein